MQYAISLKIEYTYPSVATGGRQLIRLLPAHIPGRQHRTSGLVHISPECDERSDRIDFFNNAVSEVAFHKHHQHLHFHMKAMVMCEEKAPLLNMAPTVSGLQREVEGISNLTASSPLHFMTPSTYVRMPEDITLFASEGLRPDMTVIDVVRHVGERLNTYMTFDSLATTVQTPMEEAFDHRHGVCQDFSHIMIACLRSIGIPAGYVSGFIRTLPPEGQKRLEGADAMHAWVGAWCGVDTGWVEYDPTNAMFAGTDHIVVSYGRDYDDVAPVKGVLKVTGEQVTTQRVDVLPIRS